jgi:GNAT superfamily N-acetyltransferase
MKKTYINILDGNLNDAINIAQQIPEFDKLYSKEKYGNRLKDSRYLIIIASYKDKPIGFKIGYETPSKKLFYSWMGGVLPKFRKLGVAQMLMDYQEQWAKNNNYERILVKTRKKYLAMVKLLEKNYYYEMGTLPFEPKEESRILFEKKL